MTKIFKHYKQPFEVKVDTRRGKVVVDKKGMVTLSKPYKGMEHIKIEEFEKVFRA